jgi:AcrR family transcriptional regulator
MLNYPVRPYDRPMATPSVPAAPRATRMRPDTGGKPAAATVVSARSGRRPGPTATRDTVLSVARQAFEENGYAATSLREVARRAGIDASLIVHFYGSKAGLLAAVARWPFDPDDAVEQVTAEGPERIGHRLAARFINNWENGDSGVSVFMLLQAAIADPKAASLLREFIKAHLIEPILDYLNADNPELRASLMTGMLFGFGITHYLLKLDDLATPPGQLAEILGRNLQRLAAEPL